MTDSWLSHGDLAATDLASARVHLHWAAQVVPAVADAYLQHAKDDSHSNMHIDGAMLWGRKLSIDARVGLDLRTGEIVVELPSGAERKASSGASIPELLGWLEEKLSALAPAKPLSIRDYEMPPHPGGELAASLGPLDDKAAAEIAIWFQNAHQALLSIVDSKEELAVWPHHFDLAGIKFLDSDVPAEKARQIGFGLSPGDHNYQEPYYYVTPWPIPGDADLPTLDGSGTWHTAGFTGAILKGSAVANPSDAREQIGAFLSSAIAAGHHLIPEKNA